MNIYIELRTNVYRRMVDFLDTHFDPENKMVRDLFIEQYGSDGQLNILKKRLKEIQPIFEFTGSNMSIEINESIRHQLALAIRFYQETTMFRIKEKQ